MINEEARHQETKPESSVPVLRMALLLKKSQGILIFSNAYDGYKVYEDYFATTWVKMVAK